MSDIHIYIDNGKHPPKESSSSNTPLGDEWSRNLKELPHDT